MNIKETLVEIVNEYKGETVEMTETSTFENLGFDSLDKVELMMQVEEKFDIEFADDISVVNVGDLVAEIEKLV